jgi:predicted GNAT family acetyltransferase
MNESIRMVHNAREQRYELFVGSDLASWADYTEAGGSLVLHHTETDERFRGRGLAARVVAFALDDVRERGRTVVPACWFVADFIDEHPEYADLLAGRAA